MDNEKDFLKNDLSKLETAEEVEKLREDAELLGHEDIVELANQKLQEISAKAESIGKTSESQISQVEKLGGSSENLESKTTEIDKKINEVKTEATEKVEEVKNENIEKKEINKDLIKIGSVFDYKTSGGNVIEVKVKSDVQKTNDATPREYVRVKATSGNLETDILIKDLIPKKEEVEIVEKSLSKEELTNLLKNNSLKIDRSTMNSMKWQQPSDEALFFVPKMTWNENSGVIVFSDENGETYASKSSDKLRSALFKSHDYSKNESIGVPAVNSPDGWKDPKFFEYFWKNKNKESYS